MGTAAIAVVFFAVILMMAATVAILTVVYATRLPSSAHARQPGRQDAQSGTPGQGDEGKPVSESTAPGAAAAPNAVATPEGERGGPATTEDARAEPTTQPVDAGQSQPPPDTAPAQSGSIDAMTGPDSRGPAPSAARCEPALAENAGDETVTAPDAAEREVETDTTEDRYTSPEDAGSTDPPATSEPPPAQTIVPSHKEVEATMEHRPKNSPDAQSPGPAKEAPPAAKSDGQGPAGAGDSGTQVNKSSMGDLSDLFAKTTSDDRKSAKLAEGMDEVDISDLLQEGRGLVERLKRPNA